MHVRLAVAIYRLDCFLSVDIICLLQIRSD